MNTQAPMLDLAPDVFPAQIYSLNQTSLSEKPKIELAVPPAPQGHLGQIFLLHKMENQLKWSVEPFCALELSEYLLSYGIFTSMISS